MERTKQPRPSRRRQRDGGVRFERLETLLRLALEMRVKAEGLTLVEIERTYGVSRRTAERMRDAIDRVFPELEQVNPGEKPKRWRIKPGTIDRLSALSSDDLVAVQTAARVLREQALVDQAQRLELLSIRLRSLIRGELARKIAPDLEALAEAEGTARGRVPPGGVGAAGK
ncbi:MAG: hypothetical protein FJX67_08995 [Alphaproteobacteria bacterium]|nr:hypothetical protein [Alphaproteobacteria bacterium]